MYSTNRVLKYMKQKLAKLKGEIDKSIIIVGYFFSLLIELVERKINKLTKSWTTLSTDWIKLTLIEHSTTPDYTFFSNTCGKFNLIDYIPSPKTNGNTKDLKSYKNMFLEHIRITLKISKRKIGKCPISWKFINSYIKKSQSKLEHVWLNKNENAICQNACDTTKAVWIEGLD